VVERVPVRALVPYLNETMLFQFQWGFRKAGKKLDEYKVWAQREVKPILKRILDRAEAEDILQPRAVYGYWRCYSEGDSVVLLDGEDGQTEVARFAFPRQDREGGLCIADFFRDRTANERDVIGLQVVTMGQRASEVAREWFAENHYQDYLYLHGLSVEMAEALAEYVHKRIRADLGFADEDDREIEKMLKQGYRGSRYSFGYPACPNLADQGQLLKLLGAERIGIELSDEDQLHPEQSTSAIVVHHPQAKYFSV
jgi:5-methyltetrahydrofolate--homocysteine methyltransferase